MTPRPLGRLPGVTHRVLWSDDRSMAGVLTVEAGRRLGAHTHRANHHHLWVLDGEAQILGRTVCAGSYVHVPSGVEHDIDASGTTGCTVFYLYQQPTG
jgi:quercetin dioxygenase-like cupin family protein